LSVNDLVQVFRQAIAHQVAAAVFRHPFGNAGLQFDAVWRGAAIA